MSEGESNRNAVIIPGGMYEPQAGLLAYAGEAAARRGADLELISWTPPEGRPLVERHSWVYEQVMPTPLLTMPACVEPCPGRCADPPRCSVR